MPHIEWPRSTQHRVHCDGQQKREMDGNEFHTPLQLCNYNPEFQLDIVGSQDHQGDTDN